MTSPAAPRDGSGIKAEFEKRRRRQSVLALASVACLALMVLLLASGRAGTPWFTGTAVAVAALALAAFFNWRCPACGVYLGRKPRYDACPRCGAALR
jgi:integral membrane sensor domain MASE1